MVPPLAWGVGILHLPVAQLNPVVPGSGPLRLKGLVVAMAKEIQGGEELDCRLPGHPPPTQLSEEPGVDRDIGAAIFLQMTVIFSSYTLR